MPAFLERKLDAEYPDDPKAKYRIMNAKGFMHGNKETAKGREADKKHQQKAQRRALEGV